MTALALDRRQANKKYLVQRISAGESYDSLLRFPRYFEIETVNACNARCPMCTINDWQRKMPVMRAPLFKKIADEICENAGEVRRVSLYRDGEPLLDKKLPERIAMLKDGGVRKVGISTNVALLNEKAATDILQAGIDEVILSVDSLKKDVFEAIRVRLVHEEVMENAQRFIELRNRLRPQTQIIVRMIRQESNFAEWPDFEAFWRARTSEGDRVNFLNVHNWGDQLPGFKAVHQSQQRQVPCVALWSLMVIFANGDVPMCNVDYNNKHPTGSIATHSIAELWQSQLMQTRREYHLNDQKGEVALCQNCTVWDPPSDVAAPAPAPAPDAMPA